MACLLHAIETDFVHEKHRHYYVGLLSKSLLDLAMVPTLALENDAEGNQTLFLLV